MLSVDFNQKFGKYQHKPYKKDQAQYSAYDGSYGYRHRNKHGNCYCT